MFYETDCTMHHTQCIVYDKIYRQHSIHFAVHTLHSTLNTAVFSVQWIFFTVHWAEPCSDGDMPHLAPILHPWEENGLNKSQNITFLVHFYYIGFGEQFILLGRKTGRNIFTFLLIFTLAPFLCFYKCCQCY